MYRYRRVPHFVPTMCRNRAATGTSADSPSGNVPTTRVRRLISRFIRVFVRARVQCSRGKQRNADDLMGAVSEKIAVKLREMVV